MEHTSKSLANLAVVCPVFNAVNFIPERLSIFRELVAAGAQLVFIDDLSTDGGFDTLATEFGGAENVELIRQCRNGGAGVARNAGFKSVDRPYTLFFDIDDRLDIEALVRAVSLAKDATADVQISSYYVEDDKGKRKCSPMAGDAGILREVRERFCDESFDISAFPKLLRLTNYPWNKIINTEFAREIDFRFGSTRVQNDVLAHWTVLLSARRITLFPETYITHLVSRDLDQITNDFGPNRLEMFDALEQVDAELLNDPVARSIGLKEFMVFKAKLIGWARTRMNPQFAGAFEDRAVQHVRGTRVSDLFLLLGENTGLAAQYSKAIMKRSL
ncbi:glycosyltransferase [uncultured Ruegeria sp.]|uniref:glycosyltransferase family 2 protein n=1 Tax=uncultured Ruegeria sp. TaxID=259304 RepID=UPI0026391A7E|nr:glycosyltransferase [uncultured Ruegeria sp.]